jgi:hypothetical protein
MYLLHSRPGSNAHLDDSLLSIFLKLENSTRIQAAGICWGMGFGFPVWPCAKCGVYRLPPEGPQEGQFVLAQSLTDVWQFAVDANSASRAKRAEMVAADGARTDAGAFFHNNPAVNVDGTRRLASQDDYPHMGACMGY